MLVSRVADGLRSAGLGESVIDGKVKLFANAVETLVQRGVRRSDIFLVWVPGRIEFLGKHTDYAGGRSLLCAIERGFCVAGAPRGDRRLNVFDATSGDAALLALDDSAAAPPGNWTNYPSVVARRIASNFGAPLVGADIAFASDLPPAAGMSSSSALVVATFLVLARVNALEARPEYTRSIPTVDALAEYLGAVENGLAYGALAGDRGVGTFGGSEDHTAILGARPGALVQYSFCPVRHERTVHLPADCAFVIASSGVRAEKSGAALDRYNRLAILAHDGAARLSAPGTASSSSLADAVRALGGVSRDQRSLEAILGDAGLADRVRQFAIESEQLIPAAADALVARDFTRLGDLVDQSMRNATDLLHNQIDETVFLARRACELGAVAASAFGAGFGGSVWALAWKSDAGAIAENLAADYGNAFPARAGRAEVFVTGAAGGARLI